MSVCVYPIRKEVFDSIILPCIAHLLCIFITLYISIFQRRIYIWDIKQRLYLININACIVDHNTSNYKFDEAIVTIVVFRPVY